MHTSRVPRKGVIWVSTSADQAGARGLAERLGIEAGQFVQVVGADDLDSVDKELLDAVAARAGTELLYGNDSDEVVDVVLLWWREGDGDLVDALVDSLTNLGDSGVIWLLTPKAGRDGHVEPSDIDEAAPDRGPVEHPQHQRGTRVVRHPPGRAQGQPGQAAPLTPDQARLLLSDEGRTAVAFASSLDLSSPIEAAEAVRPYGELGRLALDQVRLRLRSLTKHPDGDRLWWTAEALEQSTPRPVAEHRARRFAGSARVLDLGCSVGGDLLPLAAVAPVVGVDLDEARLLLARANADALDLGVSLVCADVTTIVPTGDVFADPARRFGGRRTFDPRSYSPPLDLVLSWPTRALGVKVAPGIDYDALPVDLEVEIVSLGGDVKEAVLWSGAARSGRRRTATLLPSGDSLSEAGAPVPEVRKPGRFLLEPDGAVIRAHLVEEVVQQVDGWLLDATIAYVAADLAVPTPWGKWYEVLEHLPFGLKPLRERLRAHDAGALVVKKRGTAVEPEVLRKQLKLTGSREVTVVLTRSAGRQVALIVRPLVRP